MRLSAVVITLNEEDNIAECLRSLRFVDEIIVVDSGSEDRTVEIASKFTDKIFSPGWLGFVEAKEYGIDRAESDWILWIDADERVSKELGGQILAAIDNTDGFTAFKMPRKSYFLGKWMKHCGWYPDYVVRLFRKGSAHFEENSLVHEELVIDGKVGTISSPIIHHTFPTLKSYFDKFNKYTSLAAKELKLKGEKFRLSACLTHPIATFFKMYIQKRGFLDGFEGLLLSVLSATYVFVKYAKLKYE